MNRWSLLSSPPVISISEHAECFKEYRLSLLRISVPVAMMINETVILLIHYYDPEEGNHRLLKDIIRNWCGIYLPFDLYLGEPLQKTFSKSIVYDYLKRRAEIGVKAVNEEIITLVEKERPKYVVWTSWQYDIQPSTMEAIRKEGAVVVGWFFDDEWRFDNYSKWWRDLFE